ncbi:MAG: hemolysin family protein [Actinomycetota bacterium]|nr:hemolysin family protein [Actinomycetota bacterium]
MTEWLLVLATFVLTAGTALFVAAEFSFVSVDRRQVEQAAAGGDARAGSVLKAITSLSTQLSSAQVGITLTALVVGFIAEPSIATLLRGPLTATGLPEGAVTPISVAIALLLATIIQMVLGELVPKNLAIARPLETARAVAGPHRAFTRATLSVVTVLNGTANKLLRAGGVEPQEELRSVRSPDELQSLVRRSAELGTLSARTGLLVERSLRLRGRLAEDVMTPRVRMHAVAADQPASAVIDLALRTGHSRFPVVGETTDDVLGVVHVKRAVAVPAEERGSTPVSAIATHLPSVPSSLSLEPLLDQLRTAGPQMAVVVDEYGGTDGLVTLEDLVEELVGEVPDEHDPPVLRQTRRSGNGWSISGLLRPDEVTQATGLQIPEGDYETIAGLVLERLGRLPRRGDEVRVDGLRLVVERVVARRLERLLVAPAEGEPESDS